MAESSISTNASDHINSKQLSNQHSNEINNVTQDNGIINGHANGVEIKNENIYENKEQTVNHFHESSTNINFDKAILSKNIHLSENTEKFIIPEKSKNDEISENIAKKAEQENIDISNGTQETPFVQALTEPKIVEPAPQVGDISSNISSNHDIVETSSVVDHSLPLIMNKNEIISDTLNKYESSVETNIVLPKTVENSLTGNFSDMSSNLEARNVSDKTESQNIPEILKASEKQISEISEVIDPQKTHEVTESQEVSETPAIKNIPEVTKTQEVSETPATKNIPEVTKTQTVEKAAVSKVSEVAPQAVHDFGDKTDESATTSNTPEKSESLETSSSEDTSPIEATSTNESISEANMSSNESISEANMAAEGEPTALSIESEPQEWLDILGNALLRKKVLKAGLGESTRPLAGDIVTIRYGGQLDDGSVVDKTSSQTIILSDEDIIPALDLALALMHDQEVALIDTDGRYAYGILGRSDYDPPIPSNAHIVYEVEILSIQPAIDVTKMTPEERVSYGDQKRVRGNDLYARGDFAGCINAYKRGLKYLSGSTDKGVLEMKIKCLNNLSAAQLKVKAYAMAQLSLDAVLQLQPKNVKALFRKGKCLVGLGKEDEAFVFIKEASMLDPQNKVILQDLNRLRAKLSVTQQKEKQMYQRMFQQNTSKDTEIKDSENDEGIFWPLLLGSVAVASAALLVGAYLYKSR